MKLYNTLSRRIENFKPLKDKEVKIYVCGITPYDTTHVGHAFTYLFFDTLIRYLRFKNYKVNYIQNITDIDDDILKKAREEKRNWKKLGDFWTKRFIADMKTLNILPPTHLIKATNSIALMIYIIKVLLKKGFAYKKTGNIYFEVKKFKNYGKLSKYTERQMILLFKERGGNPDDPQKKNPLDFILWQKRKGDEPFWESPWGRGRPGWHVECSAMIYASLGEQIDIHGGGRDLVFPHHESEIAQSEGFTGISPFAKFFVHTAMVMYEGEKIAKSLGNLIMVSDLIKKYSSNTIRFLLLSNHYRQPWEFNYLKIEEAKKKVIKVEKVLAFAKESKVEKENYLREFISYIDNDLDTPKALDFIYRISQTKNSDNNQLEKTKTLRALWEILGFRT